MKKVINGFTLIELLVVVLIIGILAAVALPQYQKAVLKTKYVSLSPMARYFKNAQEQFYLENGKYATSWEELNVDLPATPSGRMFSFQKMNWYLGPNNINIYTAAGISSFEMKWYYDNTSSFAGQRQCIVTDKADHPTAVSVCRSLGGTAIQDGPGTTVIYKW